MRRNLLPLLWLPLVIACSGDKAADPSDTDVGDTDPGVQIDPDPAVNTYIPDGYKPSNPTRVIFMGDSITDGAGAPGGRSYVDLLVENVDAAWPDHAGVDLTTSFPSITEIIDVAEGGATTNTLISRQLPQLDGEVGGFPASGETIVVFTIGGNDAQNALNPLVDADALLASVLGNFEDIVSWLQNEERFPDGVRIYATNVYEPTNSTGQYSTCFLGFDISSRLPTLTAFNDDLADLGADMGFSVVDLRGHFDAHGFHSGDSSLATYDAEDPTLWYAADCIHPNERGHHEVRRLFHAAIMGHPLALE